MTTIAPAFREHDVQRDVAGKFTGKDQSAPELTLDEAGGSDFDMATFMQEPPTVAEPFTVHQPVIYTDIDGTDIYATVTGFSSDGWPEIDERAEGTINEHTGDTRVVDPRYLRADETLPTGATRLQRQGLAAVDTLAESISSASDEEIAGIDAFKDSLRVRDMLKVGGRSDWDAERTRIATALDRAVDHLTKNDILSDNAAFAIEFEDSKPAGGEKVQAASARLGIDGLALASVAARAQLLTAYDGWSVAEEEDVELAKANLEAGRDLGRRMAASANAHDAIDAEVEAVGLDECDRVFGGHVRKLAKTKAAAYAKAEAAIDVAFTALADGPNRYSYIGILNADQRAWAIANSSQDEDATLVRVAGQAAILRHFQPETGITDAELDTVTAVYQGAIKAWAKEQK
ncbi:hypothetical protein [Microbacterium sp. 77mftsu3.1]|uniref:hypothetical protein n=1 Tax=Microbacterium sp. 77mftsu3.1 TaxID=1761802 RepID=UPI00058F8E6A|nr:hypothetical protein [Microbacterium sp. 77mftsu3.1]